MIHAITQRIIALLIVCSSGLIPLAPLLQVATANEAACPCCKHGAASCCRRHHTGSGPTIDAVQDCCRGCAQSPGLMPSALQTTATTHSASFYPPTTSVRLAQHPASDPPQRSRSGSINVLHPSPKSSCQWVV